MKESQLLQCKLVTETFLLSVMQDVQPYSGGFPVAKVTDADARLCLTAGASVPLCSLCIFIHFILVYTGGS